jgi:hypothetical protein
VRRAVAIGRGPAEQQALHCGGHREFGRLAEPAFGRIVLALELVAGGVCWANDCTPGP